MVKYPNITEYRLVQEHAEDIVSSFLEKYGFALRPPIPVDLLAQSVYKLDIKIKDLQPLGAQVVGALSVSDRVIYASDNRPWNRFRFSVAHEIGHFVLHGETLCDKENFSQNTTPSLKVHLRSSRQSNQKKSYNYRESEANWFAHALLIPASMLLQDAKQFGIIDFDAIKDLAAKYAVSNHVMFYRIRELYDYLYWKGPQIDWYSLEGRFFQGFSRITPANAPMVDYTNQQHITKPSRRFVQPRIIEFCGTANAGKDTHINILADTLQYVYGYKVRLIDEGIKECHIDRDLDTARLFKTISIVVEKLYEARYENPGNYDYIIFNRALFDRLSFLRAAYVLNHITEEQEEIHIKYLLSYAHLEDIVFLFQISPDESIRREYESKRKYVERIAQLENRPLSSQRILNQETLSELNKAYMQIYQQKEGPFNRMHLLEGDKVDIFERSVELVSAIIPPEYRQLDLPNLPGQLFKLPNNQKVIVENKP